MDALLIPTLLCPKAWESMSGDETSRFCTYCQKQVHNLEALSVNERLALLSSPAASICARYKIAIRRPARGKRKSYLRHLMKYGTGVALTGAVMLVLWEMYAEHEKRIFYRAVAGKTPVRTFTHDGWGATEESLDSDSPGSFYVEQEVTALGMMIAVPKPTVELHAEPGSPAFVPSHIDLHLDPIEINRLLQTAKPTPFEIQPFVPAKKKKTGKRAGLHGWGV